MLSELWLTEHIQRTHLALIHIPISAYPLFVHAIVSLLIHNDVRDEDGALIPLSRPWHFWHPFVNVSITPNECSIVCPREQAELFFTPLISSLSPTLQKQVSISHEDYSVITVGGEGLEAGQRVLDLTTPLALAGIPIFFITSYYTDFILVPYSSRTKVIRALEDRGFVFEADSEDGEAGHMTNPASPLLHHHGHQRGDSSSSSTDGFNFFIPIAGTPPPTTVSDLQIKTFKTLAKNNISPFVDPEIELVTCAGIKNNTPHASHNNFTQGKLQLGLVKCLTSLPVPPRFFSATLTDTESISLTLERSLLENFPDGGEDVLLGIENPSQVPITLDLTNLPRESTGIVCGVSSRLIEGMQGRVGGIMPGVFNMSYLSTSRAGHVIVYEDEVKDAMEALKGAEALCSL